MTETYGFEIFDVTQPIILDLETVSGNKKIEALDPYVKGSRVGLVCMSQLQNGKWVSAHALVRNNTY